MTLSIVIQASFDAPLPGVPPNFTAPHQPCCPVRARLVDCLTERGIVRFPVAFRLMLRLRFEAAAGKWYEAREGVSARLARTGQQGGHTCADQKKSLSLLPAILLNAQTCLSH